tara:strand:- start:29 stop:292 length:264 start_codon:yes stop_codon:yes gene_type:complete
MNKYTMFRVSLAMLEERVERLNKITSENVVYNLGSAYGGWRLEIIDENHCIKSVPVGNGFYHPKKELYYLINAYIEGLWASDEFTGG